MWRHNPQTALMVELLPRDRRAACRSRDVLRSTGTCEDRRAPRPDLGGGALLDVGCYCVSGSRLLAGRDPDRVFGEQSLGRGGVDERFAGVLRFGEVLAHVPLRLRTPETREHRRGRHEGELRARRPVARAGGAGVPERRGAHRSTPSTRTASSSRTSRAAIRGDAPPLLGRDDALGQARTLDALLRSAELAAPQSLEPL